MKSEILALKMHKVYVKNYLFIHLNKVIYLFKKGYQLH